MSALLQTLLDAHEIIVAIILLGAGYFQGRRNERRHLAELARREREFRDVLVFATRYPPPSAGVLDPVIVSGSVALAADSFKMFVAGLRKLVGGRFDAYEILISRARREAMLRLKAAARDAGCRMVFNVRVETTQINNGSRGGSTSVEVLAYGTAFASATGSVADSPHHFQPGPPLQDVEGFDLTKDRTTRKVLWGFAAAATYFFAEIFGLQDYAYVDDAPVAALVALGVAALVGMAIWLRRRRIPLAETIALSTLCGLLAAAIGYFAALRVNAMTDFSEPRETTYVLQRYSTLRAADDGLPELRFPEDFDYWSTQPKDSEHPFILRRGALGFWQFNQARYHDRLRTHFE